MIKIVDDKKTLKLMKSACDDGELYNVVSLQSWQLMSPSFKNLSYIDYEAKPSYYFMFYLYSYIYEDFLETFDISKSSFTLSDGSRFHHYALQFEYEDRIYYFSLSYSKRYGMNLYFYPFLSNIEVFPYTNTVSFREQTPLLYSFSAALYEKILTYLCDKYTLESFKSHLAIKDKYIIETKDSNDLIEAFYKDRNFSLIMPPIR